VPRPGWSAMLESAVARHTLSRSVAIERFIWTDHAEQRVSERGLPGPEVERAISERHETREVNRGRPTGVFAACEPTAAASP
jgi:hypothetical protein